MMSLFHELNRRNVFRVGAAYVAVAWLIIQVAETIFPLFGFGDKPARIVVIVLASGFIPMLALAWIFELTPEGLKKERDVSRSTSATGRAGNKLDRVIIALLGLGLGYFAIDKFVLSEHREASIAERARQEGVTAALANAYSDRSIAVLAFDDMSPDKDQVHLSDGIAEQLLELLARIPELRVISRTSAFSYKGRNVQVAQIADELNVSHILEGSVRKSGDRVRIAVQLIDTRSDSPIWSDSFDRQLDDIFAIQDEIAAAVVENLKIELLGATPTVRPSDPEAYTLFLKAKSVKNAQEAIRLLEEAVTVDPQFAQGWAELASIQLNQAMAGRVEPISGFIAAAGSANTALNIDTNNADATAVIGAIQIFRDRNLVVAARYLRNAIYRNPGHAYLLRLYALLNTYFGRLESAFKLFMQIIDRDPLAVTDRILAVNMLINMNRIDEADAMIAQILEVEPDRIDDEEVVTALGRIELARGNPQKVLSYVGADQSEYMRTLAACALYDLGRNAESDAVIAELQSRESGFHAWATALAYGCRGEVDRTFEWLERSYQNRESLVILLRAAPEFAHLHELPRWKAMLDKLGVSDADADAALAPER
jgi:TolB-like protein